MKVSFLALLPHSKCPPDCGLWLPTCWTAQNTGHPHHGSEAWGAVLTTGVQTVQEEEDMVKVFTSTGTQMLLRCLEASVIWKRLCVLVLLPPSKTNPNPLPFCIPSQTVCPWREFASPDYSPVSSTLLLSNDWKLSTLLFSALSPASFIPDSFPIPSRHLALCLHTAPGETLLGVQIRAACKPPGPASSFCRLSRHTAVYMSLYLSAVSTRV